LARRKASISGIIFMPPAGEKGGNIMALEQELEFYRSQRQVLLQTHKGQFAVIKGTKLLGTYATFEEAFNAGVAAVGTEPFLIQQILEQEEVMQNPALSVGMIYAHT